MVEWSIAALRGAPSVRSVVVACPPGHVHELAGRDLGVVAGGATRSQSVSNALAAVGTELVAVHDAARPMLTADLVEELIAALSGRTDADGVIAAAPVTDTVKEARGDIEGGDPVIARTLDRGRLWAAQTPQVFRVEALRAAFAAGPEQLAAATDEAMLVEVAGGRVLLHPSPPENIKVTAPLDLKMAELLLSERASA